MAMAAAKGASGVCAVVGCGPGMGGSAALKFAREGFAVVAMARKAETFAPTAAKLEAMGAKFSFFAMDATDPDSVKTAFGKAQAELGLVNVLVYNAGGDGFGQTVLEIDPTAFVKSFEVSCLGALLCAQAVLPPMLASEGTTPAGKEHQRVKKKGTILFSSATSAFRGGASTAQFACGKHALRALSQSIAKEYGSQGVHACHVRLDCLLDTPSYQSRYADAYAGDKPAP